MEEERIQRKFRRQKYTKLGLSVLMDLIGVATYAIPVLGESFDLYWAPFAGIVHVAMYRTWSGLLGGAVTFVEEFLPLTDATPSFLLSWGYHYGIRGKTTLKKCRESQAALPPKSE